MDEIHSLLNGFAVAFTLPNMGYMFLGITLGVLLTLEAGFVQKRSRVCKFWGKASVDGKVTCEVQFTAMIADS